MRFGRVVRRVGPVCPRGIIGAVAGCVMGIVIGDVLGRFPDLVLTPGLRPPLGRQGMHLWLLGGHGHRLEQLGERIGSARRGESPRGDGSATVCAGVCIEVSDGFRRQDDLDGAGHRARLFDLLGGVDGARAARARSAGRTCQSRAGRAGHEQRPARGHVHPRDLLHDDDDARLIHDAHVHLVDLQAGGGQDAQPPDDVGLQGGAQDR